MVQLKLLIKYLHSYTMKNLSFILFYLSFYTSLGAMFSLVFNEHPFEARKKEKKKHVSSNFPLDKL